MNHNIALIEVQRKFDQLIPLCFVTLNSKQKVPFEYAVEDAIGVFMPKICVVSDWLKGFVVGNSHKSDVTVFVAFEVGKINSVLHAHLLVGTKNPTRKSIIQIRHFLNKRWKNLRNNGDHQYNRVEPDEKIKRMQGWIRKVQSYKVFDWEVESDVNVDVRPIKDFSGVLNYVQKDSAYHIAANKFYNYTFV